MKATLRLKGGPGSGHRGHAGRPGEVGGSASGLSPRDAAKVRKLAGVGMTDRFSRGTVGKRITQELVSSGYAEAVGGPYYKLTIAGRDFVSSAPKPGKLVREPKAEFDPTAVTKNKRLSFKNANTYLQSLPGYDKDVSVSKLTDTRSRRSPGKTVNARYFEGQIEFPSKVRARSVAHELGHYLYDFKVKDRAGVNREFRKFSAAPPSGILRSASTRVSHEFFSDLYTTWLYGDKKVRGTVSEQFPITGSELSSIFGG